MVFQFEYTDTYGGEANYTWVRRETIELPDDISDARLKRIAKTVMGLTGAEGKWTSNGDTLEFRPRCEATVLFVTTCHN